MRNLKADGPAMQVLAIVLVPLVLGALGGWEAVRGTATVAELTADRDGLASNLLRVEALARRDPQATIRFTGEEGSYGAPLAASMMRDGLGRLDTDRIVAETRVPFAWTAAVSGALALLGGLVALALVGQAARRSLRSRDATVRAFDRLRRLVPVALGVQVGGVAVALLGVVVFECGGLWFLNTVTGGEVKLVGLAAVMAGLALWGAFTSLRQLRRAFGLFEPQPSELLAVPVAEAQAPGLFALVRELGREQEASLPQTVVAGAVSGFFVTSYPQLLQPSGQLVTGRTLHVSLPQLAVLSRAETRVVLAHELAHFSGEDTAYSVHFKPVYAGLQHSMAAVAGRQRGRYPVLDRMVRPASALGEYVLDRFDLAVKHWSRLREFEADRAALASEVPDGLATSLLRTAVAAEIVDMHLDSMAAHPAQAPDDLVERVLATAAEQGFIEPGRHLEHGTPHPTDTHPPTVQRIEAAGVAVDAALMARASRPVEATELLAAQELFADWSGLCRAVTADLAALAVQQEQDYVASVARAAAAVDDAPVAIHERRGAVMGGLLVGLLICATIGGLLGWIVLTATPSSPDDSFTVFYWVIAGAATLALACIGGMVRVGSNRAPFLVLDSEGFSSPGFVGRVPWLSVARITVVGGRGMTTILALDPSEPLPARTGRIWRLRRRRRSHALVFSGPAPRGMKAQAYLDLLVRYRRAAFARKELAERDAV